MSEIVDTVFHASGCCGHMWGLGHNLPTIWEGALEGMHAYSLMGICSGLDSLEIWV